MKKHFLLLIFVFSICFSLIAQEMNYNKYSLKLSVSSYKGYLFTLPYFFIGDDVDPIPNRHFNSSIHFSYRVSDVSEFGVQVGIVEYNFIKNFNNSYFDHCESFAPIVRINYNFHILPLFSKQIKKYNLYFCMKYGLTFLPRMGEDYAWVVLLFNDPLKNRVRQEYGLGIGGSVLFFGCIGVFLESYLGNFSIYPDLVSSHANTKIGIQISW